MAIRAGYSSNLARLARAAERLRCATVDRPSPISAGELYYEVDDVLKTRIGKNRVVQYFVTWTGYSSVHNSWIEDLPAFFREKWVTHPQTQDDVDVLIEAAIALRSMAVAD